jgi:hypothetical protein
MSCAARTTGAIFTGSSGVRVRYRSAAMARLSISLTSAMTLLRAGA